MGKAKSLGDRLLRFQEIHGDYYDYTKVYETYKTGKSKVSITCPIHGLFLMRVDNHTIGRGCKYCNNKGKDINYTARTDIIGALPTAIETVITNFNLIHNNKYDYSRVNETYTNSNSNVIIICKKHGEFTIRVNKHTSGRECPVCTRTGMSKPETVIYRWLVDAGANFTTQKSLGCRNPETNGVLKYDFIIENKIICEFHGKQHYEYIP